MFDVMGWQISSVMTKKDFIEKIKKAKGVVEYSKVSNNADVKVKFTNMSKKNKDWFKLECWDNMDSDKMEKVWSYQSSFISDIIKEFQESI